MVGVVGVGALFWGLVCSVCEEERFGVGWRGVGRVRLGR